MNPPPPGWPRISSALVYERAGEIIPWLCAAFGFAVRVRVDAGDGLVEHAELEFGPDDLVMVADARAKYPFRKAPTQLDGANTQNLFVYVDDVEAHFAQAKAAGAVIQREPATTDYGEGYWSDRAYQCVDPGGHVWWFAQRLRNPPGR
ncbi:MAG: aminotransferase [Vicinamibacteria bacterium]|nr:aminotransferase [Vicinamibacteria bacterium]